ncbi:hypothetical protein [Campylobacter rectus]
MYDSAKEGAAQDYQKAAKLCSKACKLGNGAGCSNLGFLYDNENGVARDSKKATRFTQKPAIRVMKRAAKPGFAYANERGAKQDYTKPANLRQSLRCG